MRCLSIYMETFSKDIQSRLKQGNILSLYMYIAIRMHILTYTLATTVNVQHTTDAAKGELYRNGHFSEHRQ